MKHIRRYFLLFLSLTLLLVSFGFAFGDMVILLKDGRTINVPVNKDDIISLSFDQAVKPSVDITWDFETGDLSGWTKTGNVFNSQPTYGDNPTARHREQPSKHQGNYWIGGYENCHLPSDPPGRVQGDAPQGTLTSQSFIITKPVINFLIGGGCDINTERVELIVNGQVVFRATGKCTETMERISWDVKPYVGSQSAQIRIVDVSSENWGHINFDDVKFK